MFETIYRWFISLFGSNLAEHLSGWDEVTGDYSKINIFSLVGIITLIITIVLCFAYYYLINHPRFNRWWSWLIVLITAAVINFGIAFGLTFSDNLNDNISSDIADISYFNCLGFGFTNVIVSSLYFVIISLIIKWGSRNAKYSPFIKF